MLQSLVVKNVFGGWVSVGGIWTSVFPTCEVPQFNFIAVIVITFWPSSSGTPAG